MEHGDGDHHGEQVLWRWRSPYENGSYCVTSCVNAILFMFYFLHAVMLEVERSLTKFKLVCPPN